MNATRELLPMREAADVLGVTVDALRALRAWAKHLNRLAIKGAARARGTSLKQSEAQKPEAFTR